MSQAHYSQVEYLRIIHRDELLSQPGAEVVLDGAGPWEPGPGFLAIPTPDPTKGHCILTLPGPLPHSSERSESHAEATSHHPRPARAPCVRRKLPGAGRRVPEPHGPAGTLASLRAHRAVAAGPLREGQDPGPVHPRAVTEPLVVAPDDPTLEEDPAIGGRYQFWTFGYSTGDPIPYSAHLLRQNLADLRRKLDPDGSDAALDRMVLVGHSMGGLLTKLMASEAGDRLWRVVSDRPDIELRGERGDVELFRSGLFFAARPEVRRVVYIATPHRGSRFDRGAIERVGMRLVRVPDPLRAAHQRLVASN